MEIDKEFERQTTSCTITNTIAKLPEIRQWCLDNNIHCERVSGHFFFERESDKLLFLLMWS